ncbi:MAG: amidohydrolase family protein, partial [Myxococcota bacterium]
LGLLLPLLLHEAHTSGRSLSELAAFAAERPARAFGIARKGRLETGYDGDLVLVDLDCARTVGLDAPFSPSCGWSPYEGRRLQGWPVTTILLGEIVAQNGVLLTEGRGRAL